MKEATVKKYVDGRRHATTGEFKLQKVLNQIDQLEGIEPAKKVEWQFLYKHGFELGYAAAMEALDRKAFFQLKDIENMSTEQLHTYTSLMNAVISSEQVDSELIEE